MWNPFARKEREQDDAAVGSVEAGSSSRPRGHAEIAEVEHIGATAVITLTVTELTGVEAAERLTELLDQLAAAGSMNFILDVQNVQHMDSACLGTLVKSFRALDSIGGRIALVNADRSVQYLFKLTKLDRVFPICVDVMTALNVIERAATRAAG
ncbi:MAG: STAS domain-containing protein [Phycisphaeraceae bacterium]|nr:MAG: STAS domain-containing protein [Phycisphaeraceae bacterium]